jgi:hypothetical protein
MIFKVICIEGRPLFAEPQKDWEITTGEIYEVVREFVDPFHPDWGIWYVLSIQPDTGYPAQQFARISDSEETEMASQPKKESGLHPIFEQILKPWMPILLLFIASCSKTKPVPDIRSGGHGFPPASFYIQHPKK